MEFKRLNKNSVLHFFLNTPEVYHEITVCLSKLRNVTVLQIVVLESIGTTILEYLPEDTQEQSAGLFERDIEFENNLDTIINTDPFGAKYSGKSIREIFECGDHEWLDKALKLMHNEFIRKKLQYIVDRGGYGKIKC